jgi:hypothetical protein
MFYHTIPGACTIKHYEFVMHGFHSKVLCILTLSTVVINGIMPSDIYAESHKKVHKANCQYTECHNAEYHGTFVMLSTVFKLSKGSKRGRVRLALDIRETNKALCREL